MLRKNWSEKIRQISGLTAIALTVAITGCAQTESATQSNTTPATSSPGTASVDRPLVVATTSVLCDLTKQVAAETIDLKCLVEPGEDPHVYQPTPEDRQAIDRAKLILYAGYDFEPTLIKLVKATSNPVPKIAVHEVAVPKPLMGEAHHHGEEHAHEGEHREGEERAEEETAPDPHVWHNAQNGIQMVATISNNLKKLSPNNASTYNNNAQEITAELQQIDTWIKSEINTIPAQQRKLVTTHDALGYYVKAYGLSYEGALIGLSTEEAPTAARLKELVGEIKEASVPTIFAEATNNPKLIQTVAKEANVKLADRGLFADGLGETGTEGDTYQKMLIANTQTIVEGLGGKFTPFTKK
ncbi:MAG: zinc ABC transporter substrate-binding protein [Cyanosarcina radialis HA8281-LM2]|jgi:manganese/iron transport system substrate-binding protein|nr:zinc ABC transporter substrate-binding protein [Cyanosarcina radialis HA8281-LM2]